MQGGVNLRYDDSSGDQMPYSLWAKVKRSFMGWNFAGRLDADSKDLNQLGIDLKVDGGPVGTGLQLIGTANTESPSVKVSKIKVSQSVDALGGTWTVIPRYSLDAQKGDVRVAYGIAGAIVAVDASGDKQTLTIAKLLGEKNRIAPRVSTKGDVEVEYRRLIGTGALTTTLKPNAFFNVEWEDGPWVARVHAPMDGIKFDREGLDFSVRRTSGF